LRIAYGISLYLQNKLFKFLSQRKRICNNFVNFFKTGLFESLYESGFLLTFLPAEYNSKKIFPTWQLEKKRKGIINKFSKKLREKRSII